MLKNLRSIAVLSCFCFVTAFSVGVPQQTDAAAKSKSSVASIKKTVRSSSSKKSRSTSSKVSNKFVAPSAKCTIKGNISTTKEKIYHVIGCPNYNQTIIDVSKGELMFCSETEAKKAGWRKALNCK